MGSFFQSPSVETGEEKGLSDAPAPATASSTSGGTGAALTWDDDAEGWKTRDLIVVGVLTFIMVIALVMAALVLLEH